MAKKVVHLSKEPFILILTQIKVCALAATDAEDSSGHLAYPGSTHVGELNIFDTVNLRAVSSITAHDNPIG